MKTQCSSRSIQFADVELSTPQLAACSTIEVSYNSDRKTNISGGNLEEELKVNYKQKVFINFKSGRPNSRPSGKWRLSQIRSVN